MTERVCAFSLRAEPGEGAKGLEHSNSVHAKSICYLATIFLIRCRQKLKMPVLVTPLSNDQVLERSD